MAVLSYTRQQIAAPRDQVLSASIPIRPINPINALTQVRRSFDSEEVDDLAQSILAQGQHTPGTVAFLRPDEAKQYVAELNELWGTRHKVTHLHRVTLDGVKGYFTLIAGHRRMRALTRAIELQAAGERAGEKFTPEYLCDVHFGLTVEEAITIQFHENRHQQVPVAEEVQAALCTWRFMRRRHPDMSRSEFGDIVGRGSNWITRMLRFASLPESVQELIEPNEAGQRVSYQLLCEVARLIEGEERIAERALIDGRAVAMVTWTEASIISFIDYLIARRVRPSDFCREVSKRLVELEAGQGDLFVSADVRPSVRKVAVPELVNGMHAHLNYWHEVEQIRRRGGFDVEGSPFAPEGRSEYSPMSVIGLAIKTFERLHEVTPHLTQLALREGRYRRKLERSAKRAGVDKMVFEALAEAS